MHCHERRQEGRLGEGIACPAHASVAGVTKGSKEAGMVMLRVLLRLAARAAVGTNHHCPCILDVHMWHVGFRMQLPGLLRVTGIRQQTIDFGDPGCEPAASFLAREFS